MRLRPCVVASPAGALFGVVGMATLVRAASTPTIVIVRIYDGVGLSHPDLDTATQTTSSIFNDVGIGITWRFCRSTHASFRSPDQCGNQLRPAEFSVRLLPAHRTAERGSFGYSYVDTAQRSGVLSTLFIDRIFAAAARIHGDRGVLIGRVMAHELGHLLLGTTSHDTRGLMRGLWLDQTLQRNEPEDWSFSREDVAMMSQTLMAHQDGAVPAAAAASLQGDR